MTKKKEAMQPMNVQFDELFYLLKCWGEGEYFFRKFRKPTNL